MTPFARSVTVYSILDINTPTVAMTTDEEEVEARRERISRIASLREQASRVSVELAHLEQANVDLEVAVLEAMSETDEVAKNVLHVEAKKGDERNGDDGVSDNCLFLFL